jgi:hypothetical protein
LALFSKETSAGYFLVCSAIAVVANSPRRNLRSAILKALPVATLFFSLFCLYYLIRVVAGGNGPRFAAETPTSFHFRLNLLINHLQLLGTIIVPFSSALLAKLIIKREVALVLLFLLVSAALLYPVWIGIRNSNKRKLIHLALLLLLLSFYPVALMNHVAEVYSYNSAAFWTIIAGVGYISAMETSRSRLARDSIVATLALFLLISGYSTMQKCRMMTAVGDRAAHLLEQISTTVSHNPNCASFAFIIKDKTDVVYSHYYVADYYTFRAMRGHLADYCRRPTTKIDIFAASKDNSADLAKFEQCYDLTADNPRLLATH